MTSDEPTDSAQSRLTAAAAVFLLYVGLFHISGLITYNQGFAGTASILFLPAFVRLFGVLIAGWWSIPALWAASYVCLSHIADVQDRALVAACLATGAPLAVMLTSRLIGLRPTLRNLQPMHLFWLALASGLGNSLFYNSGLWLVGLQRQPFTSVTVTFIGDVAGTWFILYCIKFLLHLWWAKRSSH